MLVQEGPSSFYRGLVPTLLLVAPNTALQFGLYTLFTVTWNRTVKPLTGTYDIGEEQMQDI